jgi:hypothetical protein
MSYEDDVLGCYDDIVNKLRLPPLFRMNKTQYVYTWICPNGYWDIIIDALLQNRSFLIPRLYDTPGSMNFSNWNTDQRHFEPTSQTLEIGLTSWHPYGTNNIITLNGAFDKAVNQGGIYHLMWHPQTLYPDRDKSYFTDHLKYISRHDNIWYVNLGHLYLYHLLQQKNTTGVTTPAVPAIPIPTSPINAAVNILTTPTLTWKHSSNATLYHVQISTNPTFSSMVINSSGIPNTSFNVKDLANMTTYYWRVNASNVSGTSGWSNVMNFTTIFPLPVLNSPADDAKGIVSNPTLKWDALPGALSYRLQVSVDSTFTSMPFALDSIGIADTLQVVNGLKANTTYHWRVNATNVNGTSGW